MTNKIQQEREAEAATQFDRHENRTDGKQIAPSLYVGIGDVRDLLYLRIHHDVETAFGADSLLMPVSAIKSELKTKAEIDLYAIAESTATCQEAGYVTDINWYRQWLTQLRRGNGESASARQRLAYYAARSAEQRRHAFAVILERVLPDARRAPLVLYRLLPLAVQVVTATAFDDTERAEKAREQQQTILPIIAACRKCGGKILDNGEQCDSCGNPLWKFDWLTDLV